MWDQGSQTLPQFKFWSTIIEQKLLMTRFVWSPREGGLHVQACDKLCSWFHAMDHTHYACWLPIHVHDMVELAEEHPKLHAEFLKGHFCCRNWLESSASWPRTKPMNIRTKVSRHMVELLDFIRSPKPLQCLSWPDLIECTRVIEGLETVNDPPLTSTTQHEEGHSLQLKNEKDVLSFIMVVELLGNPFLATGQ